MEYQTERQLLNVAATNEQQWPSFLALNPEIAGQWRVQPIWDGSYWIGGVTNEAANKPLASPPLSRAVDQPKTTSHIGGEIIKLISDETDAEIIITDEPNLPATSPEPPKITAKAAQIRFPIPKKRQLWVPVFLESECCGPTKSRPKRTATKGFAEFVATVERIGPKRRSPPNKKAK